MLLLATPEERASRLPALGSQLGLDLAADERHSHRRVVHMAHTDDSS